MQTQEWTYVDKSSWGDTMPMRGWNVPLTNRQEDILWFIGAHIRELGLPPTIREIGEQFGIRTTNGVMCHLVALERKGRIERLGGGFSRGIRVICRDGDRCPLCGK